MGALIIESAGAYIPARRVYRDPYTHQVLGVSARSHTPRSFQTAIRADIGEAEAYKHALLRGEIGLQQPMGANVRGVDFITVVRESPTDIKEILCTDVKTSAQGTFPTPKTMLPGTWFGEVLDAVSPARLKLRVIMTDVAGPALAPFPCPRTSEELAALEAKIIQAVQQYRIRRRQLNANYSAAGQGLITGW
jgi:hypothetical protein